MDNIKIKQALTGGIAATAGMTIVMLIAPMMGMPNMKIGNTIAAFMNMPIWLGWLMHIMIGIFWAGVYVFLFNVKLALSPAIKGMLFSLLPWMLMQLMVMPIMGMGIFSSHAAEPVKMVMGTMIGHLVYGLILGLISKED